MFSRLFESKEQRDIRKANEEQERINREVIRRANEAQERKIREDTRLALLDAYSERCCAPKKLLEYAKYRDWDVSEMARFNYDLMIMNEKFKMTSTFEDMDQQINNTNDRLTHVENTLNSIQQLQQRLDRSEKFCVASYDMVTTFLLEYADMIDSNSDTAKKMAKLKETLSDVL